MLIYDKLKTKADEHWLNLTHGSKPWIRVGTAMCGRASGSSKVLEAIESYVAKHNIEGICYAEPLMDIMLPGESRLFLQNVDAEDVPKLLDSYVLNNQVPKQNVLGYMGEKPIPGVPDINILPGIKFQQRIVRATM